MHKRFMCHECSCGLERVDDRSIRLGHIHTTHQRGFGGKHPVTHDWVFGRQTVFQTDLIIVLAVSGGCVHASRARLGGHMIT